MTRVTLICKVCSKTARADLPNVTACRGVHETPGPSGVHCPNGHGPMVRKDGVDWVKPGGVLYIARGK